MKITVTVKPNSRRGKIEKKDNGYLVWVKEKAKENKANKELIKVLAAYFGTVKSRINILSGVKSRQKIIEIKDRRG